MISTDKIYHNLDELKQTLPVPDINTGRTCNFRGFVFDDTERLRSMLDPQGSVMIYFGTEMSMTMYRGQIQEHKPCLPTLGRIKRLRDQYLALCRNVAFEEAIEQHPFVKVAKRVRYGGNPLRVDTQGLVQHYELTTDRLDLTSNFNVASFFATCKKDEKTGTFLPCSGNSTPGVIYRMFYPLLDDSVLFAKPEKDWKFRFVGWQPLPRPEQQRAFSYRLDNKENFNQISSVQRSYFYQDKSISERLCEYFDQGRALFPTDPAAELASMAKRLTKFTREQTDKAWDRMLMWNSCSIDSQVRQKMEKRLKIEYVQNSVLSWDNTDIVKDESYWEDKLNSVLTNTYTRGCLRLRPEVDDTAGIYDIDG